MHKLKSKISAESSLVLIVLALALFVRLYHLGVPSFCDDEISTTRRIHHSLIDTILLIRYTAFPPLHYAILNLWARLAGTGEWALRFPSAIFSSLTVIVMYKLGKELFSKNTGVIAALLLTFSTFAINYAQNGKMYALYWFLTALSFLFFFYFLREQKKSSYSAYILTSVLCCYTMYTGFLILVVQGLILMVMAEPQRWKKLFTAQLIVVFLCLPWLAYFLSSPHEILCLRQAGEPFNYVVFWAAAFWRMVGNYGIGFMKLNCFLYVFLIIYVLVETLSVCYKNRQIRVAALVSEYCLLIWLLASLFIYFMIDYFFIRADLTERYMGFLQVPLILLVSSQIDRFPGLMKKILLCLMLVVSVTNTYLYFDDHLRIPEEDWRKTSQELAQEFKKNDIVLSLVGEDLFKYYYTGDTRRFFWKQETQSTPAFLAARRQLIQHVDSLFIIYEGRQAPEIKLEGFLMDSKVSDGASGFLHFQRQS